MKTIKARLFAIYGGFAFISVLVIAISLAMLGRYLSEAALGEALDSAVNRLQTRLKVSRNLATALAESIAHQPNLAKALADRNRFYLQTETVPLFHELSSEFGVSQLQFHLPPATSFFRAHKPGKFGDDLSSFRHTVVATNRNKTRNVGLEKGRAGYGVRAVVPVTYAGKHTGSLEIGISLKKTISKFTKNSGVKVALFQLDAEDGVSTFDVQASRLSTFEKAISPAKIMSYNVGEKNIRLFDAGFAGENCATELFVIRNYAGKPVMIGMVGLDKRLYGQVGKIVMYGALILAICAIVINGLIFYWLDIMIFRRFARLIEQLRQLADGNTDIDPEHSGKNDEIAQMAAAVTTLRDEVIDRFKLRMKLKEDSENKQKRQEAIEQLVVYFRQNAGEGLERVAGGAAHVDEVARKMADMASRSRQETVVAGRAAGEAAQNVQSVASATEEMSASIAEVSRQISFTDQMVNRTEDMARDANRKIGELADNADKISKIVTLIKDIAEQTNLLALNATIEAARAGDAGKGFAVVATEVKALAEQTAGATEEIGSWVMSIQNNTGLSVEAVQAITANMADLASNTTAITAAAEQQGATTFEISGNIAGVAERTRELAENIAHMDNAMESTEISADLVLNSADEMALEVKRLNMIVDDFIKNVQAA